MPTVPDMVALTPAALKIRSVPRQIINPQTGEVMQVVIDHPKAEYVYVIENNDGTVRYIGADDAIKHQDELFGASAEVSEGTPSPVVGHMMKVNPWTGEVRMGSQTGPGRKNVRKALVDEADLLGILS